MVAPVAVVGLGGRARRLGHVASCSPCGGKAGWQKNTCAKSVCKRRVGSAFSREHNDDDDEIHSLDEGVGRFSGRGRVSKPEMCIYVPYASFSYQYMQFFYKMNAAA